MRFRFNYLKLKRYFQIANIIGFTAIITLFLMRFFKKTDLIRKSYNFKIFNSESKTIITEAAANAFDTYEKYCSDADEVYPLSHECKNSQGFYASAVESLESLYLLGLKNQYAKAKKIVLNKLLPNEIGWVNRAAFWSRCIGSLIGIHILSGESEYINRATLFAEKLIALQMRTNYPQYVNFKKMQAMNAKWLNETVSISDMTAGLPELIALANLTGINKFMTYSNQIVGHFPLLKKKFGHYYDLKQKTVIKEPMLYPMDSHVIDAYNSLLRAYLLKPTPILLKKIQMLYFENPKEDSIFQSQSLLETSRLMELTGQNIDLKQFHKAAIQYFNEFQIFKKLSKRTIINFNFNAQMLHSLIAKDEIAEFDSIYFNSFEKLKYGDGYSGMMHTSNDRWVHSGLQNSDFFGQWIKVGVEYLLANEPEISKAIVNNHGHILQLGTSD